MSALGSRADVQANVAWLMEHSAAYAAYRDDIKYAD